MKTLEQFIQNSNDLFAYIAGGSLIDSKFVEIRKEEYENLLMKTVMQEEMVCKKRIDGVNVDVGFFLEEGYKFLVLAQETSGVFRSQIGRLENKYSGRLKVHSPLGECANGQKINFKEAELRELISKLVAYKSGKYVVITQNKNFCKMIDWVNDVFCDTTPIEILKFSSNSHKENIELEFWPHQHQNITRENITKEKANSTEPNNVDPVLGFTLSSWGSLDD